MATTTAERREKVLALCKAASDLNYDLELLGKLIKEVNINEPYQQGFTAMHYACRKGHMETVLFLVTHGGNLDLRAENGRTPRSFLSDTKLNEFIAILLKNCIDSDSQYKLGLCHSHAIGGSPRFKTSMRALGNFS